MLVKGAFICWTKYLFMTIQLKISSEIYRHFVQAIDSQAILWIQHCWEWAIGWTNLLLFHFTTTLKIHVAHFLERTQWPLTSLTNDQLPFNFFTLIDRHWVTYFHINKFIPLRLSAAYMRQQPRPSLVTIMACRLFGAKPLSELMLRYCQLILWDQTSVTFCSKFKHFNLENLFENVPCQVAAILPR